MKTHKSVQTALILILGGGLAFASHPSHIAYPDPLSPFEATVNLAEPERERIQRHLAAVEADMRAHPPAGLTDAQLKKRLALLDELRAYRERGEFPKNLDFPDRLIPYFIDAAGVPCAMGRLVIASGHAAFAEEIRATRNNAYIAELAAMDGRLAAWGEEHGITLEEAARVQPAYGAPRLIQVQQVGLDSLLRPWAFGHDLNVVGNAQALFYRQNSQWTLHSSVNGSQGFCLTNGGEPAVLQGNQVAWKGRTYTYTGTNFSACEWSINSVDAWAGSRQGLHRLRRTGTQDTLLRTRFTTSLASDTVTDVAVSSNAVWAATRRGLYRRGTQGADTAVTVWDSAALGGSRVTGVESGGGARVWVGIEGVTLNPGAFDSTSLFSSRGLRRTDGTTLSQYRAAMSSVMMPSDTIFALAMRDTGSVWIATPSGFYRFQPSTGGGQKVADIPGVTVFDMAGNASGFYAGTSSGVYQYRNDSLVFLGSPAVSIRPGIADKQRGVDPKLRMLQSGRFKDVRGVRTVLGQKAGPRPATGVYVSPASEP